VKLVREHINEKFTDDGSDPIKDMGIGIYVKRNFNTREEAANWIIKFIPAILGVDKIPENIVIIYTKPINWYTEEELKDFNYKKLEQYILEYIDINELQKYNQHSYNSSKVAFIISAVYKKLEKMGYKRWR
jgi:hypothetical protein